MPDQPGKSSRRKAQAVNLDTIGLEMGNKPPQALEVEEAVLGAMLIEPSSVDMALEELSPSCFYDPRHKMIYEAMSELVNEHTSVDIVTVSAKLREKGNLETVGGPGVLAGLSEKVGAAAHIEYYVKILKQKSIQRDLITASYEILRDSYDDSVKVDQLIDEAQTKVYNAIQNNLRKDVQEVFGFPFLGSRHSGVAEVGPYHPGGQAFCRKDRVRPEPCQERRRGSQYAGGGFLT